DPEGEVHRAATDDAPAVAGQAQGGQGRVVATPARSRSGNGYLLAIRRHGALPVLWGPHERRGPRRVPVRDHPTLAMDSATPQPDGPRSVDPHAPLRRTLAAHPAPLPSLPVGATRRCHPRQEPDAVMPHVRIRGGGGQRWSF